MGENAWKITSALAARHIGGAINFVSVCETLSVNEGSIVSAAIAADNVVVALYFAFLFYLAIPGEEENRRENKPVDMTKDVELIKVQDDNDDVITMQSLSVSIAVASCLVTLGKMITTAIMPPGTSVSSTFFTNASFYMN